MALLQIAALLGPAKLQAAAAKCRRTITEIPSTTELCTPSSLEELVAPSLRSNAAASPQARGRLDAALELVGRLLEPDPAQRIDADAALSHRFLVAT